LEAKKLEYSVIPAEPLSPPSFSSDISFWGVGGSMMAVAFFLTMLLTGDAPTSEGGKVFLAFLFFEVSAISISILIFNQRREDQLGTKRAEWMAEQIAERGKKARELGERAREAMNRFYASLRDLPGYLEAADMFLNHADQEFQERAYGPFWDNIEQSALQLGAFNSNLARIEGEAVSYKNLLAGQIHNFPSLVVEDGAVPNPTPQADRLRRLARMGQKDFEFATIWEQRKTQNVIVEGFHTLGEAVNRLGITMGNSFSRVNSTIEESSNRQLQEQVQLRGTFELALREWEEQKRLYGTKG
jgi:hypothetical protein